jgi:VCBS repeat-containing protein
MAFARERFRPLGSRRRRSVARCQRLGLPGESLEQRQLLAITPHFVAAAEYPSQPLIDAIQSVRTTLAGLPSQAAFESLMADAFGSGRADAGDYAAAIASVAGDAAGLGIAIETRSAVDLQGHAAAFAPAAIDGLERIYINGDWLAAGPSSATIAGVVLEEVGHAIDHRIGGPDAPGDEGRLFSSLVRGDSLPDQAAAEISGSDDHGLLSIDGSPVAVEFAIAGLLVEGRTEGLVTRGETADGIDLGTISLTGVAVRGSDLLVVFSSDAAFTDASLLAWQTVKNARNATVVVAPAALGNYVGPLYVKLIQGTAGSALATQSRNYIGSAPPTPTLADFNPNAAVSSIETTPVNLRAVSVLFTLASGQFAYDAPDLVGTDGSDLLEAPGSVGVVIRGGGGPDILAGSNPAGTLIGGGGVDAFAFEQGDGFVTLGGAGDLGTFAGAGLITDFVLADGVSIGESLRMTAAGLEASVAANATVQGRLGTLTIAGSPIASHRIRSGIVSFDVARTFVAGLRLTSPARVAAAIDYLRSNDLGVAGTTVAFTTDSYTDAGFTGVRTFVYTQHTVAAPRDTAAAFSVVELRGVTATALSLTGSTTAGTLSLSNDLAPIANLPASLQVLASDGYLPLTVSRPFADFDPTGDLTVSLAVGSGSFSAAAGNGITSSGAGANWSFTGAVEDLNAYFLTPGNVAYLPAVASLSDTLTLEISDGLIGTSYASTIAVVDDSATPAPAATDIRLDNDSVAEDSGLYTVIGRLASVGSDATCAHLLVPGQGDADNGAFVIEGDDLKAIGPFDFEVKSVYSVRVRSQAPGGGRFEKVFEVRVVNVDDPPVFTSPRILSVAENISLATTVTAVDPEGLPLTYTISAAVGAFNVDSQLFAIDPVTGELSFIAAPDFETPGNSAADNIYRVRVLANDGTLSAFQNLVITVTDALPNGEPAGTDGTVEMLENGVYTFTAADFGFTDPLDTPANGLLAVVISSIPTAGSLALAGTPVSAGQVVSAAEIPNLTYEPAAYESGAGYASFTFQVQDDGGTVEPGGIDLDATPNLITINVTDINEPAVITGEFTGDVAEDGIASATGTLAITDPDPADSAVSFGDVPSTVGDSGYGAFELVGGAWTYTLNNDAVQFLDAGETVSDTITFTATDGSTQTVTVTITGDEDAAGDLWRDGWRGLGRSRSLGLRHACDHRRRPARQPGWVQRRSLDCRRQRLRFVRAGGRCLDLHAQ